MSQEPFDLGKIGYAGAMAAAGGWRIYEVGISYSGRTYAEGKKIRWTDGVAALWHIVKFNLFSAKAPIYRSAKTPALPQPAVSLAHSPKHLDHLESA